jgi:hypothetical protein
VQRSAAQPLNLCHSCQVAGDHAPRLPNQDGDHASTQPSGVTSISWRAKKEGALSLAIPGSSRRKRRPSNDGLGLMYCERLLAHHRGAPRVSGGDTWEGVRPALPSKERVLSW